ncbi:MULTISPECIES: DNA repair protein RadC [unclassified Devosia]|uniref:JAB domain-containing protein n=1 Tax=unclassified Devosia TaxID=196773 RepID=UPI00155208D5|nr:MULTISPECIES: DNA repair protein RadC [unclassified Devosia]
MEILMHVVPDVNASALVSRLMSRFGSLPATLSASANRLTEVDGVTDDVLALLRAVRDIALCTAQGRINFDKRLVPNQSQLLRDYLHVTMAFEEVEHFRVFFIDPWGKLIADELLHKGTVDHAPVYPREVVRRALDLSARSMILVHNHPSGDPSPSSADVTRTQELVAAAAAFDIRVDDHIIVGKAGEMSLGQLGLLDP